MWSVRSETNEADFGRSGCGDSVRDVPTTSSRGRFSPILLLCPAWQITVWGQGENSKVERVCSADSRSCPSTLNPRSNSSLLSRSKIQSHPLLRRLDGPSVTPSQELASMFREV